METIGTGKGVAALFNAHARQFSVRAVRALTSALPDALVLVSEDFAQAQRHADTIVAAHPHVVLAGGGDGSIVRLLNLLRDAGAETLPRVGTFKLGTGNAWARTTGAGDYYQTIKALSRMPNPLPTRRFDLVEVENTLCHFAGMGWDARILNDYLRNLDRRSSALIGSRVATRLHKGLFGYMYSLFRITVPEEFTLLLREGQVNVTMENLGDEVFTLDSQARAIPLVQTLEKEPLKVLYHGPASVVAAGTTPEWGFGFRAFPFAQAKPGFINMRIYDRTAVEATRNMMKLWRGEFPQPGMHDFYVKRVSIRFSRPSPFQIGGDGLGMRDKLEFGIADQHVDVVDWSEALRAAAM